MSRTASVLGVAQVIQRGTPLIDDPVHLGGVSAVGVDETAYLRANPTRATTFATGVADLTPGRSARLLDVVEGRSGTVLADWLGERDSAWRAGITTASLDPFRGYAALHAGPGRARRCAPTGAAGPDRAPWQHLRSALTVLAASSTAAPITCR